MPQESEPLSSGIMAMRVQTKDQVLSLLAQHHHQLRAFGVQRYGLFGSFVRNQATSNSDVDILVEFNPSEKTFENFMHLSFFLEDILERKIDLITIESLSPYIGPHILREVEYAAVST
jgi:uncharacterized protein